MQSSSCYFQEPQHESSTLPLRPVPLRLIGLSSHGPPHREMLAEGHLLALCPMRQHLPQMDGAVRGISRHKARTQEAYDHGSLALWAHVCVCGWSSDSYECV